MKIPEQESDYLCARCTHPENSTGCKSILIDEDIMPSRRAAEPDGSSTDVQKCMRGVDIMFLAEAVGTRSTIVPAADGMTTALEMDGKFLVSRPNEINAGITAIWNDWAQTSRLFYSFPGRHYNQIFPPGTDALLADLKNDFGFSSAVGTRITQAGTDFGNLLAVDIMNLFNDLKIKQCAIFPLLGAGISITGGRGASDGVTLASFSEVHVNKYGIHDVVGPLRASSLTVTYQFPASNGKSVAAGSRVKLFAVTGYHTMVSADYPREQEVQDGVCLVSTDDNWHEVGSNGLLSASVSPQAVEDNIIATAGLQEAYPEAPEDSDPESEKSRQAQWSYYLSLAGNHDCAFFALFDLEHTNLVNV